MELKEKNLFPPLQIWLKEKGYKVYTEVINPISQCSVDVLAIKENEIIAVELKMGLTDKVLHQANRNNLIAHKTYCGIPTNPKAINFNKCKRFGMGILKITGKVEILLESELFEPFRPDIYIIRFDLHEEGGEAGLPRLKGEGVTYEMVEKIREYQKNINPNAKWKEIYNNIPNHYSSAKSMAGSLRYYRNFYL